MIDFVLAANLRPGTNQRVDLTWTNWAYLLPRLDSGATHVDGEVPDELLNGLHQLGHRVVRGGAAGPHPSPHLLVIGRGGGSPPPGWHGPVFEVGRRQPGSARLAARGGPPRAPVHALAMPLGKRPLTGAAAVVGRARRVTRRAAVRARVISPPADRAERTRTLAVTGDDGDAEQRVGGTLSVPDQDLACVPDYVAKTASDASVELDQGRWRVLLDGDYHSQKVVFFVGDLAVKVARVPSFAARLDNEHASLAALSGSGAAAAVAPRPRFRGYHAGLSIVGESLVRGDTFSSHSQWRAGDPLAQQALTTLLVLGQARLRSTAPAAEATRSLQSLVRRYREVYRPDDVMGSFLEARLEEVTTMPLPTVFQHGDPGTWNMVVDAGQIRLLDWENGEVRGVPTWDASVFVEAYASRAAVSRGVRSSPRALARMLFADTSWSRWHAAALQQAADSVDLKRHLLGPIFVLGCVYRAVREIPRLDPDAVGRGQAHQLLRECYRAWDGVAMRRLRAV